MNLPKDLIGLWGAIVSTLLAIRTIYLEIRTKIFIDLVLWPQPGTQEFSIVFSNLTSRPVIIKYFIIYIDRKSKRYLDLQEYADMHQVVSAHSTIRLNYPMFFLDQMLEDGKLSTKYDCDLYIVGRTKPYKIKINC